jgi:hypothetical protein
MALIFSEAPSPGHVERYSSRCRRRPPIGLTPRPVLTVSGTAHPTGHLLIVQEPEAIAQRVANLT